MNTQEILEAATNKGGARFVSDEALHLTTGGRVVPESDPAGAFVLCGAGGSLPLPLAKKLGLVAPDSEKAVRQREDKAVRKREDKAVPAPEEDK